MKLHKLLHILNGFFLRLGKSLRKCLIFSNSHFLIDAILGFLSGELGPMGASYFYTLPLASMARTAGKFFSSRFSPMTDSQCYFRATTYQVVNHSFNCERGNCEALQTSRHRAKNINNLMDLYSASWNAVHSIYGIQNVIYLHNRIAFIEVN